MEAVIASTTGGGLGAEESKGDNPLGLRGFHITKPNHYRESLIIGLNHWLNMVE
jgi:hypothetical protein